MTGPGFVSGEDFVAARISIDVPTEGLASLRELTQEIERFRTNTESASRTADSFTQYLKASAEAAEHAASAQQGLVAQLQQMAEVQQRIASGSATSGGVPVPQGHVDPFASSPVGKGGAAPPTTPDATQQVEALRARDPRAYLNQQSAIGNVRPGDITGGSPAEIQQASERVAAREQTNAQRQQENPAALPTPKGGDPATGMISQAAGLAKTVMGAGAPGGSVQGILAAGAQVAGTAAASAAAPNGILAGLGMGGLAKFAGPVGLGLSAALAGYGLTQYAGEELQNYKNMGSIRGGGAMQGMGYEMSIRAMAMDPFLTNEQSRQIIQSALSEGYTGQTFDTVTKFIASNLKDLNMSVGESVKLLRTNVNEGGESIAGLAANLATLKEAAKTGVTTMPELQATYGTASEALIKGAGVSGPQAGQAGLAAAEMFKDSLVLKGKGGDLVNQLATSPTGQMAAFTLSGTPVPRGALPGTLFERTGDGGMAATSGMLKRIAQMAQQGSGGDEANGAYLFQMYMARLVNVQLDRAQAAEWYHMLINGQDPVAEGQREAQKDTQNATKVQWRSPLDSAGGTLYDIGKQLVDVPRSEFNLITSALGGKGWDDVKRRFGDVKNALSGQDIISGKGTAAHVPMMDRIIDAYGPGGIEILDENQKAIAFSGNNRAQLQALSEGKYTWREKGTQGPGTKLSDTPLEGDLKTLLAQGKQPVNVQGSVTLDLTPEARRALTPQGGSNVIQLTPHERQSNAGYGNARPNNAAPGEGPMTRGRSGW